MSILRAAETRKALNGIKNTRDCSSVSHISFADDTMTFCRATEEGGRTLMTLLDDYEKASGQRVNLGKSSTSFESSVNRQVRDQDVQLLGMREVQDQGKYLGLPSHIGRCKKDVFSYLIEKVGERIRGWKGKLLNQAGKEVMIKSVVSAIPNFVMNCFKLLVGIIDTLNSLITKFFWASSGKERGIHWKSGATYGWRVATKQASLLAKILKGRYYRHSTFLKAKLGSNPSFGWRSLLEGRKVLNKGVKWRVGDGKDIDIWKDPWIPRINDFVARDRDNDDFYMVSQLMRDGTWKENVVANLFVDDNAKWILAIPISKFHLRDKLIWHHTRGGDYLTSSGYKCARELKKVGNMRAKQTGESNNRINENGLWKTVWGLRILLEFGISLGLCGATWRDSMCHVALWNHRNNLMFEGEGGHSKQIWTDGIQMAADYSRLCSSSLETAAVNNNKVK
ncbi:hypothetical protein LIER_35779 [Lithospermum erythrorhizon]|uniref:Reverse transcriptase n=1 Tax=Lithospermum erythrorhizon TaxID=34254 RepID=A0AAV3NWC7_LITER